MLPGLQFVRKTGTYEIRNCYDPNNFILRRSDAEQNQFLVYKTGIEREREREKARLVNMSLKGKPRHTVLPARHLEFPFIVIP